MSENPQNSERRDSSKGTGSAVRVDRANRPSTKQVPSTTPEERLNRWSRFFEKTVPQETVHDVVLDLVQSRQYEEVIVCIEQAILSGQIQPWMYQLLALSMQAAKRPGEQIERVILSSQDVVLNDPRSMMRLAAYLANFERYDRALELYRQAAALDPSRPEPYVLALELAVRAKNYRAVVWSAPEVLAYSWGKERERLNRLAENAAAEAETALFKSGDVSRAFELKMEMQKARRLDLSIRLEWSGKGDLDLQIREPGGTTCSTIQPMTASGGIFLHDGFGPIQEHCYEEYVCPRGLSGDYWVVIRHVSGEIVGKRARLTIIRDRGTDVEDSVTETIFLGPTDQTVRLSLSGGRRMLANAERQDRELKVGGNRSVQQSPLAQLGQGAGGGVGQVGQRASGVGYTPIVSVINEGVRMSALATVSGDRRYVRISVVPTFTSITDVFTFSFQR